MHCNIYVFATFTSAQKIAAEFSAGTTDIHEAAPMYSENLAVCFLQLIYTEYCSPLQAMNTIFFSQLGF